MLTAEQILALAPDAASAKAGTGQANASLWSQLGYDQQALWGLCQGSGKEPYRTQIELATPSFKCSCPSRKFPCKHGLGLYLLFAKQKELFVHPQPAWVSEWLQGREQRAEKKAVKQDEQKTLTAEEVLEREKSAQKRTEKRENNVRDGVELLLQWLDDVAKEGLATIRAKDTHQWEKMAARMIDAQAPGLATRIRNAGTLLYAEPSSNDGIELARELAQVSLLCQAYLQAIRDPDRFTEAQHADMRTAIGWNAQQEEVKPESLMDDVWIALGNSTDSSQRIMSRACYLYGVRHKKLVLILQFAAGNQVLPPPLLPGKSYTGALQFYRSSTPLRVFSATELVLSDHAQDIWTTINTPEFELETQLERYAQQLASNPFQLEMPMILNGLHIQYTQSEWRLIGTRQEQIPLSKRFRQHWHLHALSGGQSFSVFGIWNGLDFLPVSLLFVETSMNSDHEQATATIDQSSVFSLEEEFAE